MVKISSKKVKDTDFKKYLEKIEDPNYTYQQDNDLSDEEVANKIKLTVGEVRDILYCHIDYFTLDRLVAYASRLFAPSQIKISVELEKKRKTAHARTI
ncbi:hypothetical protein C1645_836719 [Glomus cerebriforme]|uniref:Uncharacterized protein n=1 Tax=Glomus cerebriforme TaxID=658196 RepID=A0A397SFT2_9GLOM|nr:hypothetical protein C1645_836719 [Glomus cerebriforme]